ncbi:uncharacterized protein RJT21DRAFT_138757 [Scheffersomyces amazonensis]|uniref:uncharacterized protein n=1 Tax=Scheffersomyces amazonensis TaxID=1078765 RepID=UPI00315CE580
MDAGYHNEEPSTPPAQYYKRKERTTPTRRLSLDALNTPVSLTKNLNRSHGHSASITKRRDSHRMSNSHSHSHSHSHSSLSFRDSSSVSSNLSAFLLSPGFTPIKSNQSESRESSPPSSPIRKSPLQNTVRKSTVGRGRIPSIPVFPNLESEPLPAPDDSISININIPSEIDVSDTPHTPARNIITEQDIRQWYEDQNPQQQEQNSEDEEEEHDIIRQYLGAKPREAGLENPFLETSMSSSSTSTTTRISNPFITAPKVDYSTHLELVKPNGEKFVEELSPRAKMIKPKKLNFSNFNTLPPPPPSSPFHIPPYASSLLSKSNPLNPDISSKYISKNLNGLFNAKPKNVLDFEIYNDDKENKDDFN